MPATVTGKKPWSAPIPKFVTKMMPKEFGDMFTWIREKGFKANIPEVRKEYPQLLTFAGWAKKIFAGDYQASTSASLTVTNTKTGVLAYADASDRASANRGYRSSAEKLAKYLKKKIEDDEKKLGKAGPY